MDAYSIKNVTSITNKDLLVNLSKNNEDNHSNTSEPITFTVLYGLIFLFGIISNSIVIMVYLFNKEFKNHSKYFFANLSISDILVLLVCVPVAITDLFTDGQWKFGEFYCRVFIHFFIFFSRLLILCFL
jgi:hypothetical protein